MRDGSEFVHLELSDLARALRQTDGPWPDGIGLRTAELPADLPLIAELYNAAFEDTGADQVTPEQMGCLAYHPSLSHRSILLAFAGNTAVGLVVGSLDLTSADRAGRRGAIELLVVRPGYRRRGIGRALVHAILRWLADQGVSTVSVSAEGSTVPALLARYGFEPVDSNPIFRQS